MGLYKRMQSLNDADRRIGDKLKKRRYVKNRNQDALVDRITDERNYKTTVRLQTSIIRNCMYSK